MSAGVDHQAISPELNSAALAEFVARSDDGMGVLDSHLRFLYVNPAGCRILGHGLDELVGRSSMLVTPPGETADIGAAELLGMPEGPRTAVIVRPDGQQREIEYTATALEADGRNLIAGIFRDVTGTRRAERWAMAFAQVTSGMTSSGPSEAILDELARGVVDATGMVGCAAILFDPGPAQFRVVGAHGLPPDYGRRFQSALAHGVDLPAVHAFQTAQPVIVRRIEDDPVLASDPSLEHDVPWETIVCVPMGAGGRAVGVLKSFLQATLPPEADMVAFLVAAADQAAVAIDNTRLFAETRETSRRQEALVKAGLTLAVELSLPTVLTKIVECACDVSDATYGALGVLGADGVLTDFITHGITDEQRAAIGHLPVGQGLLGALISDARPVRLQRLQDDSRSGGFPPNHPPMTSFLGVPVTVRGRVYGNLYLTDKRGAPAFTEVDERAVVTLAAQAGIAIENARLFAEARARLALEERTRLARELHDSVSQALFAMTLETGAAQRVVDGAPLDPAEIGRRLRRLRELTEGALAEMRALIFALRPDAIREEGLVAAIRKQAEGIAAREDLHVVVEAPDEPLDLTADAEEQLYRLTQEALGNVARHAHAEHVCVRIELSTADTGQLTIEVQDDGIGFDPSESRPGHLGLRSMTQRAESLGGHLTISSRPRNGTTVRAVIPTGVPSPWSSHDERGRSTGRR